MSTGALIERLTRRNREDAASIRKLRSDSVRLRTPTAARQLPEGTAAAPALDAAASKVRSLLALHPVADTGRDMLAVLPAFGEERDPAVAQFCGQVLSIGVAAFIRAESAGARQVEALLHTAFAADDVSAWLRGQLIDGGLPGTFRNLGGTLHPLVPAPVANACLDRFRNAIRNLITSINEYKQFLRLFAPLGGQGGQIRINTQPDWQLSPDKACAGAHLTLTGNGFGNQGPLVRLAFTGLDHYPLIVPMTLIAGWTDERIDVVVPPRASAGPRGLVEFPELVTVPDPFLVAEQADQVVAGCLGLFAMLFRNVADTYIVSAFSGSSLLPVIPGRRGNPNWFVGSAPTILEFAIDGASDATISAGDSVTLTWKVENADQVEIAVVRSADGDRNQLIAPGVVDAAGGSWQSAALAVDWSWSGAYELRATNGCGGQPTTARVAVRAKKNPPAFLWGVALAAGQYESNLNNDWTAYTSDANSVAQMTDIAQRATPPEVLSISMPGESLRHDQAPVAVQEIGRARTMRLNAYRLSLEWSRIEPQMGNLSTDVLDELYIPLLQALRAADMEPIVTLHHLSNPLWVLTPPNARSQVTPTMLEDDQFRASLEGWENAATVDAYVAYVTAVVTHIRDVMGDDTPGWWVTLNEPIGSMVGAGYAAGLWPPGFLGSGNRAMKVYQNVVRAHVRACLAIRAILPDAKVGVVQNTPVSLTLMPDPGGLNQGAATQTEYFYIWHSLDAWHMGTYDQDFERRPGHRTSVLPVGEFFGIDPKDWRSTLDFVGVNYYRSWWIRWDPWIQLFAQMGYSGGLPTTSLSINDETAHVNDLAWRVDPASFSYVLHRIHDDYGLPILVTENGMADATDRQRPSYTVAHTDILRRAIEDGVDIRGYLHWSITDNWEWQESYRAPSHFGLYDVDRTQATSDGWLTLPRRPKETALAMASLASGLLSTDAALRFGSFTDDGSDYVVPTKSACRVWRGMMGKTALTFLLTRLNDATNLAWIRDSVSGRWVALDELSGTLKHRLIGANRAGWGVPERELELRLAGSDLEGSITIVGGIRQKVRLTQDPLVGTWLGDLWPFIIHPFGEWESAAPFETAAPDQPPVPYLGRWLKPLHPKLNREWDWLAVQPDGGNFILQFSNAAVCTVTPEAGVLEGPIIPIPIVTGSSVTLPASDGTASWMRAPDDLV